MIILKIIGVLIFSYVVFWYRHRRLFKLANQVTSKYIYVPFIGHLYLLFRKGKDAVDILKETAHEANRNNGITSIWLANRLYIVITDPYDIEKVLTNCLERDDSALLVKPLLENSSLIALVSRWRPRRKVLASVFGKDFLNNFVDVYHKQSAIMLKQLQLLVNSNKFHMFKYIGSCTFGSIIEAALGVNMNSKSKLDHPFIPAFHKFSEDTFRRLRNPLLHFIPIFKLTPLYYKYIKNVRIIQNFVDETVTQKREEIKKNGSLSTHITSTDTSENVSTRSALELILKSTGFGSKYTNIELREELLSSILAGSNASAMGISFVVQMLARYPDIQEKVFQEIIHARLDSKNRIHVDDIPKLVYLEAVIKESIRLYPPIPNVARKVVQQITLPSGFILPPGARVLANSWGLHRNVEFWGPDASEFKPERFIDNPPTQPAAYLSFSHGPRNCLGIKHAMLSMKIILSSVIRNFRILPAEKSDLSKPLNVKFAVFLRDADYCEVRLERRCTSDVPME